MPRGTLLAVCLLAVLLVACDDAEPEIQDVQTPDPTATTAPPTPTAAPTGSHTGVSEIDTVLDTVFTGDEDAVRALMQYRLVACVTEVSIDPGVRALCRDGEEAGALVEVFSEANCHGNHIRREDTGEVVATLAQPGGRLRAVARGRALGILAGDYIAVYDHIPTARTDAALAVMIDSGKIVGMHGTCGMTALGFLDFNELDDLLLYNGEDGLTGIPEIDTVLETVFTGDEAAVEALIGYTPTACATNPQGLGSPPQCREGESDGALSDFFSAGSCHGVLVRPEDMDSITALLSGPGSRLRAVSELSDTWPNSDHIVLYDHVSGIYRVPHQSLALFLLDGEITGMNHGCGSTPDEYLEGRNLDPLLFIPPEGLTGIRDLDIVLDGLLLNDPDVVGAFIRFQFIPCSTTPEGIDAPPLCRPEDEAGTRVQVFPLDFCDFEYRRPDEMDDVRRWVAEANLHAVYATDTSHEIAMRWPPPDDDILIVATAEGRHIVAIDTCSQNVFDVLDNIPPDDILVGPLWP